MGLRITQDPCPWPLHYLAARQLLHHLTLQPIILRRNSTQQVLSTQGWSGDHLQWDSLRVISIPAVRLVQVFDLHPATTTMLVWLWFH